MKTVRRFGPLAIVLGAALLLVALATVPGCTDKQLAQAQAVQADAQTTLTAVSPAVDVLRADVAGLRASVDALGAKVAATTQPASAAAVADAAQLAKLQSQLDATTKILDATAATQQTLQDTVTAAGTLVSQLRAASTQPSPALAQAAAVTGTAATVASAIPVYGEVAGGVLGLAALVLGALARSNAAGKSDALTKLTAVIDAVHTNAPDAVTADVLADLPADVLATWNTIRASLGHYAVPPGGVDTLAPAAVAAVAAVAKAA